MIYSRALLSFVALYILSLTNCSGVDGDDDSNRSNSGGEPTGGLAAETESGGSAAVVVDSGSETSLADTGGIAQSGGAGGAGAAATNTDSGPGDSSSADSGVQRQDSGADSSQIDSAVVGTDANSVVTEGGAQPPLSAGSCCEQHAEPGCDNAEIQACVCDKLPDCCTTTWDLPCTLIVTQKFCEPGVRECVCGPAAEGGWEQTQCCETEWTSFCDETAVIKCDAKAGC